MSYEVSYDKQENIILVRAFGEATHEEHRSAQNDCFWLCKDKKCTKVLVDLSDLDTKRSSSGDFFESGECFAQADIDPSTRFAFVVPKDPQSVEDLKFTVTVAENRGRISALFDTVEQAKNWLLGA
jgi:hypothetical protein